MHELLTHHWASRNICTTPLSSSLLAFFSSANSFYPKYMHGPHLNLSDRCTGDERAVITRRFHIFRPHSKEHAHVSDCWRRECCFHKRNVTRLQQKRNSLAQKPYWVGICCQVSDCFGEAMQVWTVWQTWQVLSCSVCCVQLHVIVYLPLLVFLLCDLARVVIPVYLSAKHANILVDIYAKEGDTPCFTKKLSEHTNI